MYPYFANFGNISLSSKAFRMRRLHQNNHHYGFILQVCEFLYEQILIQEGSGHSKFKDFDITEA